MHNNYNRLDNKIANDPPPITATNWKHSAQRECVTAEERLLDSWPQCGRDRQQDIARVMKF
ncbi:MAG: hypothetical protein CBB71_18330 [Rhodopirellula sp. TMED11]|nr:MAG: hypothetical protein CBB71_18330 [Rhodopirellula sp. TMED11]